MKKYTTADEIFERTMRKIAPLPCQKDYARQLASILSFHIHKNTLMDDGISVDDLPSMSAVVVAPTGQGKTYLIRKMAEILDLNCIVVDCSTLAAEGWKGVGLSQRLMAAKDSCAKREVFERSLLFLDEVDKIRYWGTHHDQGNPMSNILQLYNSGTVAAEGDGRKGALPAPDHRLDYGRSRALLRVRYGEEPRVSAVRQPHRLAGRRRRGAGRRVGRRRVHARRGFPWR